MNIAFFDFDGTLTKKDTFFCFIIHAVGIRKAIIGFSILFPFFVMYKFGIISSKVAKEHILTYFFKGIKVKSIKELGCSFSNNINKIIDRNIMKELILHKEAGDEVVIVSASSDAWLGDWCQANEIKLIATKLESVDGCLTGKIDGENCSRNEKILRIFEYFDLSLYHSVFAYGNSRGDQELLKLADFSYYKGKNI